MTHGTVALISGLFDLSGGIFVFIKMIYDSNLGIRLVLKNDFSRYNLKNVDNFFFMAAIKTIFCLMQIFIAYTIFTSLSWVKSFVFTPMVVVGKLSSFQSSLVGKLIGYQEIQVHHIDSKETKTNDEDGDGIGDKESKNGDIEEVEIKTSKVSLSDSGTVLDKNGMSAF